MYYNFCSYLTTCIIDWGRKNELFVNLNHELTKNHINHDFTKYQVNPNCNYFKTLKSFIYQQENAMLSAD